MITLVRLTAIVGWALFCQAAGAQNNRDVRMSIAVINIDGTGYEQLVSTTGWLYDSPSYSGDQKRILFDGWPIGMQQDAITFTAFADGSEVTRLGGGAMPTWSPDETMIAFHEYDVGALVANSDGTGREIILPEGGSPVWSPDGKELAILRWSRDIQIVDLYNGKRRALNEVDTYQPTPGFCWSPDGTQICLVSMVLGQYESTLTIANASHADHPMRSLETGLIDTRVGWSPDGKTIAFSRAKALTQPQQIFLLDVEPSATARPLEGQPPDRSNINPSWAPDGKKLIFASYRFSDQGTPVEWDDPPSPPRE